MVEVFDNWIFFKCSNINGLRGVFFVLIIPNNFNTSNGDITAKPPSPGRPTLHSTKTSFGTVQRYKGEPQARSPLPNKRTCLDTPHPSEWSRNLPTIATLVFCSCILFLLWSIFFKVKVYFRFKKRFPNDPKGRREQFDSLLVSDNVQVYLSCFSVYHSLDRASLSRSLGGIAHPSPEPVCTGSTSKPYRAAQVAFNATWECFIHSHNIGFIQINGGLINMEK